MTICIEKPVGSLFMQIVNETEDWQYSVEESLP